MSQAFLCVLYKYNLTVIKLYHIIFNSIEIYLFSYFLHFNSFD